MENNQATPKNLPAEIADFYDAIVAKVAGLRVSVRETIASVKKEQAVLATQLEQNLAKGESLRKADFKKLLGEIIAKRQAREKEVMAMLAQFHQEEQALAVGLKKLFGDGRQVRLRDFKKFIAQTKRATEARKGEIAEITKASEDIRKSAEETIARFRQEREEMAKSWQALAARMRGKRSRRDNG